MVPNTHMSMSLILPEKEMYIVLDLKDAFFNLPLAEVTPSIFILKQTQPREVTEGNLPGPGCPENLKFFPTV